MGGKSLGLWLVLVTNGCSPDEPEWSCDDPKYGNGTCDLDTTCGAPDIDCFTLFKSAEEAKAWWDSQPDVATRGSALPVTDMRYPATQELIDEGWEAYKSLHTVGKLADERPYLVLVDSTVINAFVYSPGPDRHPGFAVMVNAGLVDTAATKAEKLGVMMHEFEHALGLHGIPEVKAALEHYYATPTSSELLGYQQADNPAVRALYNSWAGYQVFAGVWSDVELGGMPISAAGATASTTTLDLLGFFGTYFKPILIARAQAVNTQACNDAANLVIAQQLQVLGSLSKLDTGVTASATFSTAATNALVGLRDNCFAGLTQGDTLIPLLAQQSGYSEAAIRMNMPDDLEMALATRSIINAWAFGTSFARQRMREIEAMHQTMFGSPWTRLRIYTTEDAADESSARTMTALGLDADGAAQLLIKYVSDGEAELCNPLLAMGGAIPYGENLPEPHHSNCWRAGNQRRIGADAASMNKTRWEPIVDPQPVAAGLVPDPHPGFSE